MNYFRDYSLYDPNFVYFCGRIGDKCDLSFMCLA